MTCYVQTYIDLVTILQEPLKTRPENIELKNFVNGVF